LESIISSVSHVALKHEPVQRIALCQQRLRFAAFGPRQGFGDWIVSVSQGVAALVQVLAVKTNWVEVKFVKASVCRISCDILSSAVRLLASRSTKLFSAVKLRVLKRRRSWPSSTQGAQAEGNHHFDQRHACNGLVYGFQRRRNYAVHIAIPAFSFRVVAEPARSPGELKGDQLQIIGVTHADRALVMSRVPA